MSRFRERPKCRKEIEKLLEKGKSLKDISESRKFSEGIRIQAKKMIKEKKITE